MGSLIYFAYILNNIVIYGIHKSWLQYYKDILLAKSIDVSTVSAEVL